MIHRIAILLAAGLMLLIATGGASARESAVASPQTAASPLSHGGIIHCGYPAGRYVPRYYLPLHWKPNSTSGCGVLKKWYGHISRPEFINVAYRVGYYWCVALAQKASGPYTIGWSWFRAIQYCGTGVNAWHYVAYSWNG